MDKSETMNDTPPHLQALEEIEQGGIPGLPEVLREEGIDGVRYALWNVAGWHRDYSPPAWRSRATEEQKREGWEMAVRIEKIVAKVLHETHKRQIEEVMDIYLKKDQRACTSGLLIDPGLGSIRPLEVREGWHRGEGEPKVKVQLKWLGNLASSISRV